MSRYLLGKTYSQNEIDKASESAYQSEFRLLGELGKYKGYHDLMYTKTSELFKPITQSTSLKMKQETDDQIRQEIQNDPSLSTTDKLQLMSKIDKIKLEKHTPITSMDKKQNLEETRKQEIADAFRVQDDFIFGLVSIHDSESHEGAREYMFGVLNVLDNLNMLGPNRDVLNHHRIRFNNETGKVEVAADLFTEDPKQSEYPYSKDLLWLLTQNTLEGSDTAKRSYMDIVEKCLKNELERHRFAIHENYDDFLHGVKGNKKFEKWISIKYKIPLRVQPKRAETSGRTKYTDTSVYKATEDESESEGSGFIILSPNAKDRIKRAFVLLGNRKSSKDNNPEALYEFTSILDSLMSEGSLDLKKYKLLMKKW